MHSVPRLVKLAISKLVSSCFQSAIIFSRALVKPTVIKVPAFVRLNSWEIWMPLIVGRAGGRAGLVMSIGNQEFGIPRKYQYQIGTKSVFGIYVPNFLVFSWYFIGNLEYGLVKIWFNIGIFRQNKNRFGTWILWLPFHWYRFGFGLLFS